MSGKLEMGRREMLGWMAACGLVGCAGGAVAAEPPERPVAPADGSGRVAPPGPAEAVAFDALAVFDPRPVFARANALLGDRGPAFVDAWRTALFGYQWLRALGEHYADFMAVNDDALRFAARKTGVELTAERHEELAAGFRKLRAWPDVRAGLDAMRAAGLRLALLSNMTVPMLEAGIAESGLGGLFEHVLSTDSIRTYKPAPAAYALGPRAFGLPRERIAFAAFAGWDAAGAAWFGYRTVWVNRAGAPADELGAGDVPTVPDLAGLRDVLARR